MERSTLPNLMVMPENGKMLLVETKGGCLDNNESETKAWIGAEWAALAGRMYNTICFLRQRIQIIVVHFRMINLWRL